MFSSFFYFFLIICVSIVIHEYGHLLAARFMRVPVNKFSVGFGPVLFRFFTLRTQYQICLIPLGGYVALGCSHNSISSLKSIVISLAGPLINLFVFFVFVFFYLTWDHCYLYDEKTIGITMITEIDSYSVVNLQQVKRLASSNERFDVKTKSGKLINLHAKELYENVYCIDRDISIYDVFFTMSSIISFIFKALLSAMYSLFTFSLDSMVSVVGMMNINDPNSLVSNSHTNSPIKDTRSFLWTSFRDIAYLNLSLGIFNLLPLFPLDGGRVAVSSLSLLFPFLQRSMFLSLYAVSNVMFVLFIVFYLVGRDAVSLFFI